MPRIRTIKPELPADVKLASVTIAARLTFVYSITQADDHGLIAGNPRQLLGVLFPLDQSITEPILLGWVEELVGVGLMRWRSTRDGVPVLQIANWSKHQRIDNAGRSQLLGLLAESPSDPADVRGDSPRVAEVRGLDQRPRTEDLGPVVGGSDGAIALSIEANRGLAEHPTKAQPIAPIIATNGKSYEAAEEIAQAGVPLTFAQRTIYELARSHASETPIKSLRYFVTAVIRAWQQHVETEAVKATSAPPPLRLAGKSDADPLAGLNQWAADQAAKEKRA